MGSCTVEGCGFQAAARGYCKTHYSRWRKYGTVTPGNMTHAPLAERLWRRVAKAGPDDCWEWQGNRLPSGYGQIGRGGRGNGMVLVHRAAYEITCGAIPEGQIVLHSCDNPPCCNPAHLTAGTYADNTLDMVAKQRNRFVAHKGENNGYAVLTPDLVRYIRSQKHRVRKELAAELGLDVCTVRDAQNGRTWKHVT